MRSLHDTVSRVETELDGQRDGYTEVKKDINDQKPGFVLRRPPCGGRPAGPQSLAPGRVSSPSSFYPDPTAG